MNQYRVCIEKECNQFRLIKNMNDLDLHDKHATKLFPAF